jgi:hypothetical protein
VPIIRPRIIRTLLYKEVLRYVHNWGALVVVFALVGLAALIALGDSARFLPGQAPQSARNCRIWYGPASAGWAGSLRQQAPPEGGALEYRDRREGRTRPPRVDGRWIAIDLFAPGERPEGREPVATWTARTWYPEDEPGGVLPYQAWMARHTDAFLGSGRASTRSCGACPRAGPTSCPWR